MSKIPIRYFKDITSKSEGINLTMNSSGQKLKDTFANKNGIPNNTGNLTDWEKLKEKDYTQ